MLRFLRYAIEIVAGFIAVAIVLALLLAWRLSSAPVTSDFMTPYIEAGIEGIIPDSDVHVGSTLLTWNAAERLVSVHADGIKVADKAGEEIANIPSFDAKISVIGIVFGQFVPKDLAVEHPQIKLVHNAKGAFVFGGMAVNQADNATSSSPDTAGNALQGIVQHLSHAALMHKLSVTQAVFDVHDEATQQDWSVSIPEISVTRHVLADVDDRLSWGGLKGHLAVEVTQKDSVATLNLEYGYDPDKQEHTLSTVFEDVDPAFIAGGHLETLGLGAASAADLPLSGKVKVTFDKDFAIDNLDAEIHGDAGHLVYADFWEKPCLVKSLDVNAVYNRAAQKLDVSDTRIDFEGPVLGLEIEGSPPTHIGKDLDFAASITVENMPMNRYGELWPKAVLPDPRYWLDANLRDGIFTHGDVSLSGDLAWKDLANVSIAEGSGKLSATGGRVTYLDGLPPVENVSAIASFDLKKMDVAIMSGNIGNIKVSPFTVHITGLADPDQNIEIPLQVAGPVPEILRLLDYAPLGYAKKLGIAPDDLGGQVSGMVSFKFPLLRTLEIKDMDITAAANTTNIASTKLVPGIAIDQGNLAMTLDMNGFAFKGPVNLDKVPFQIAWQEAFTITPDKLFSHMTINGVVKDDQWKNFGIDLFDGSKGAMNVALNIDRPTKAKSLFNGTLDMTPSTLSFPLLNWKKPANSPATLKFTANQTGDKPVNVTSLALQGAKVTALGDAILSPDMSHVLSLNLAPLVVGRSNASLHLTQSYGDGGALKASVMGASFDMTGLNSDTSGKADTRPKDITVQVDKLYNGDIGEIDKVQGNVTRDSLGWRTIDMHGLADGDAPMTISLKPQPDGHSIFTMACDDFGKMMKGLGFTDHIKGGKFTVDGASTVDAPRVITSKMKITAFTAQKLPVLALLLNAASPFGFTGILTDSTDFSRFEGDLQWQGDEITFMKAHGAGSAVGINMDGKINVNSGDANLAGTVVPFSVINSVLNTIPLLGDLITGGKDEGVLAVAYTITGNLGKPDISVNPISLLTPGFVRNLFFKDDATDEPIPERTEEGKDK